MTAVVVVDDCDPDYSKGKSHDDGLRLFADGKELRVGGLNNCQSVAMNRGIALDPKRDRIYARELVEHQITVADLAGTVTASARSRLLRLRSIPKPAISGASLATEVLLTGKFSFSTLVDHRHLAGDNLELLDDSFGTSAVGGFDPKVIEAGWQGHVFAEAVGRLDVVGANREALGTWRG